MLHCIMEHPSNYFIMHGTPTSRERKLGLDTSEYYCTRDKTLQTTKKWGTEGNIVPPVSSLLIQVISLSTITLPLISTRYQRLMLLSLKSQANVIARKRKPLPFQHLEAFVFGALASLKYLLYITIRIDCVQFTLPSRYFTPSSSYSISHA